MTYTHNALTTTPREFIPVMLFTGEIETPGHYCGLCKKYRIYDKDIDVITGWRYMSIDELDALQRRVDDARKNDPKYREKYINCECQSTQIDLFKNNAA